MTTLTWPAAAQPERTDRGVKRARPFFTDTTGNEPPLELGSAPAAASRRTLSYRWLGASVLTGLVGGLLLGSAIFVSSRGQVTFAEGPERVSATPARAAEAAGSGLRKGDKLVRAETVASAKQVYRAPMTLRSGEREVIKARSFTRISTGLSLTSGAYATAIPPFNPLRFFSAEPERGIEPPPETSDAEVSVVKTDLAGISLESGGPSLTDADVAAQIGAEARAAAELGRRASLPLPSPPILSLPLGAAPAVPGLFTRAGDPAFRSIEVRVVPENVTDIAKAGAGADGFQDRSVPIRRGDTVENLLRAGGAGPDEARLILAALGRERLGPVEGMQLRLLTAPPPRPGGVRPLVRAILLGERGIEAIAALNDRGTFVSVAPPVGDIGRTQAGRSGSDDEDDEDEGGGVRLYDSLYETGLKHDLSRQTVEELIRIFGYDVDFQRRVAPGDSVELFYAQDDEGGADRVEILSATLMLGSETRRVFRYQGDDGSVDFFDEAGRSLKKFLLRKPIVEARLTSGFGSRFHPILGYGKMHTGVDWANRAGTPIFSAGNGTVMKAEWDSGYGRRIEVQHANGYVTTYNHMSAFARGMARGTRVRQGQVIGFVGSTGLSTGAHLHYEVIVNGHFVDPMKIRVPRGRELDGRALADFSRQRDQIEGLMQRAGAANRFAQRADAR